MNHDNRRYNQHFIERVLKRHPEWQERYDALLRQPVAEAAALHAAPDGAPRIERDRSIRLEAIVREDRPVLFVQDGKFNTDEVTTLGPEAQQLVQLMRDSAPALLPLLPLIGRIDVVNSSFPYAGTGWFIDSDIVVTNRHVASLIARWDGRRFVFVVGAGGRPLNASLCNTHEYDDPPPKPVNVFNIVEVLYIEPDHGPNDIAFLRVVRRPTGNVPVAVPLAQKDINLNDPVVVVGYPAIASRNEIPDQDLMHSLYKGKYNVKRAAPGYGIRTEEGSSEHDSTTLGGNSGSVVLDPAGRAVGLHFAGAYKRANYAVPVTTLLKYVERRQWNAPIRLDTPHAPKPPANPPVQSTPSVQSPEGACTFTIPLTITVAVGGAVCGVSSGPCASSGAGLYRAVGSPIGPLDPDLSTVENAARLYWEQKPAEVLAARVGFFEEGEDIGHRPFLAVSVAPRALARFESQALQAFMGVPVRYLPADVSEQLDALPQAEAAASVEYDDVNRTGAGFSMDWVRENMTLRLHVGPEYSWDELKAFLGTPGPRLVSAMYEFHADHIRESFERHLQNGGAVTLVLDAKSFSRSEPEEGQFDRDEVFEDWAQEHATNFKRIVVPLGSNGLVETSYHIKVTVRDDNTFWLSSGNWKGGSSQPIVSQQERDAAATHDIEGNREWHVVVQNETLATCFRNHILQDFKRSKELGGAELPRSWLVETLIDVPIEEMPRLERPAPGRVLEPMEIRRAVRVRPLLTPDHAGAVYSEEVLRLIRSAQHSLLFQIPYIAMPSNPSQDRGYIDELLHALTRKLKSLDDARVILRAGGSEFSSPMHAAWYFRKEGVDIDTCLRVIEDHHTKGMIVDGKRVLVGSHNWSRPGVSLNRDASLLFDDEEVAGYYAQAFEIDWERSRRIQPRQFRRGRESIVREAVGSAPEPGFRRVRLSEWLKDE